MSAPVVVCTFGGLVGETEEVLTLARRAARDLGAPLRWLVLGTLPDGAPALGGRYGVTAIDRIADATLAAFQPDLHVEALAQYCTAAAPRLVLFSQTFDARLLAPRLAGRLRVGVIMNAVAIETAGEALQVTAAAFGGDTRTAYTFAGPTPHLVAVAANATEPEPEPTDGAPVGEIRDVAVDLTQVAERIRVVQPAERAEGPKLEDAQVIVAGGRGLGEPENFKLIEELAAALGGVAGASRPIVDDGWTDPSRQVGLTGKITRPALYIAAGISGASQHMVGCAAAKTLVAINRDREAAIFNYARFGIEGDCLAVLPELIRAAKER